jgi:hypothetical protein
LLIEKLCLVFLNFLGADALISFAFLGLVVGRGLFCSAGGSSKFVLLAVAVAVSFGPGC